MKKYANIPIFIAHEGCPNTCVFCNQKKITGTSLPADRDIIPEIERALSTVGEDTEVEIAFFGGSFTGIERDLMTRLLSDAYRFVESGRVAGIRLSTRPDYIDEEILDILERYGVQNIELGIQSASDRVLLASKRGHTFEQTERACSMIVERGFTLGGQMMTGLPESTVEDEVYTARKICELGAREARIYPTVVFCDTELCDMARDGRYTPPMLDEAVERTAAAYKVFLRNGVKVLRIGLQSSDNLSDESEVYAGANHPALRELCEGRIYLDLIKESIACHTLCGDEKRLVISCAKGEVSKVTGHKKENIEKLRKLLGDIEIKVESTLSDKYKVETKFEERK